MDIKDLLIWIPAAGFAINVVLTHYQIRSVKIKVKEHEKTREEKIADEASVKTELNITIQKLKKDVDVLQKSQRRNVAILENYRVAIVGLRGIVRHLIEQKRLTREDIAGIHLRIDDFIKEVNNRR